jgi:hypothetical protein
MDITLRIKWGSGPDDIDSKLRFFCVENGVLTVFICTNKFDILDPVFKISKVKGNAAGALE